MYKIYYVNNLNENNKIHIILETFHKMGINPLMPGGNKKVTNT